jgi:hypothetical protein
VGIFPLKHESPHEMGIKEIEDPVLGAAIGLNLETSPILPDRGRGQANERR